MSRASFVFFFSSRRRHTRCLSDWSSDVCSSDLSKMGLYFDAAETFWQKWVVGYDPSRQGTLADRVLSIRWLDGLSVTVSDWDVRGKAWLKRWGPSAGLAAVAGLWLWLVAPRLAGLDRK